MKTIAKITEVTLNFIAVMALLYIAGQVTYAGVVYVIVHEVSLEAVIQFSGAVLFVLWRITKFFSGGNHEQVATQEESSQALEPKPAVG